MVQQLVAELGPQQGFGEMSLITEEPRTATIQAVSEVCLAVVTKEQYLHIVAGGMVKALEDKLQFLGEVPALREMKPRALRNLSLSFQRHRVPRGCAVYRQGDEADAIYLVRSGQCRMDTSAGGGAPGGLVTLTVVGVRQCKLDPGLKAIGFKV